MDLCADVILGMDETPADRVDAALELRKIGVSSLPVNILVVLQSGLDFAAGTLN